MTNNMANNTTIYCNIADFERAYREVHGHFSILVCVFGSIANVLNICVLTTKEMRWPTNFILTGLALADLMVMLDYIPYAIHVYFNPLSRQTADYFTYPWALYMFFHALFAQVCHFISCCLTLILAFWRYVAVTHPQNNKVWCSAQRTKWAIFLTYITCPIMCFPIYVSQMISSATRIVYQNGTFVPKHIFQDPNFNFTEDYHKQTIYYLNFTEDITYTTISFWVYGVVIKLVPCIILTVFSHQLIKALIEAKKRRYNLLSNKGVPMKEVNGKGNPAQQRCLDKDQQTDRTTRMLLAVLLLFLITEFPQAILGLLSATIGETFEKQCQRPLGDLVDIFALTNSAINFILYCSMSRQFRTAFHALFVPTILKLIPQRIRRRHSNNSGETGHITAVTNV